MRKEGCCLAKKRRDAQAHPVFWSYGRLKPRLFSQGNEAAAAVCGEGVLAGVSELQGGGAGPVLYGQGAAAGVANDEVASLLDEAAAAEGRVVEVEYICAAGSLNGV